jgi:flagellar biosynthesis/type III secretory pathway chaperone
MSLRTDQTLAASLKQMLEYCHAMQTYLKSDQEYFSKNDLEKINNSNNEKAQLISRMSVTAQELKAIMAPKDSSISIMAALEVYAAKPDTSEKREIQTLVRQLKPEIDKCYQSLLINSKVVNSNLSFLKNIWDRLLSLTSDGNTLYDHKGTTR